MKFVQRKGNDAHKGAKIWKKMNSKTRDWFADNADRTPRRILGYQTPQEVFSKLLEEEQKKFDDSQLH